MYELITILEALQGLTPAPAEQQLATLTQLGLVSNGQLVNNALQQIGQHLFDTVMIDDIRAAFHVSLSQARTTNGIIAIQLRFDEHSVDLSCYPWELLHDGRRPLLTNQPVELARYISYPEAPTPLTVRPPLHLVYIAPRPSDLSPLPRDADRQQMLKALAELRQAGVVQITEVWPPTYEALLDCFDDNTIHILHFDGHGTFARACPRCTTKTAQPVEMCKMCGANLLSVAPQGYLAFEDGDGSVHWVKTSRLAAIARAPLRLAILLACSSGAVEGKTLFTGLAPALVQAGIPAVVAMQLPISIESATSFTRGFYRSLARFEPVGRAVNAGRQRLSESEWFIPVLYLRSQDVTGRLFE